MSILLPKSIVSVSYQYRNFSCESINISIGIEILDIESISISIGINFLISSLKLSITAIYTPLWTLECQQNIRFHCFFGQEMAILSKNLVSKLVSELSREVSVYRYQFFNIDCISICIKSLDLESISIDIKLSTLHTKQ